MGNMLDYLDWRGDIPFTTDPFHEVDALVLSELSYVDFAGIVPGMDPESLNSEAVDSGTLDSETLYSETADSEALDSETLDSETVDSETLDAIRKKEQTGIRAVSIQEAAKQFWKLHTAEEVVSTGTLYYQAPYLLDRLCSGRRFGNMYLTGYVNRISLENNEQMSAVTCLLDDGTAFAVFRGTDDTMIGWKEDFSFSFENNTGGQKSAAGYLDAMFGRLSDRPLRVGGHSKGGNFAVYASAFCGEPVRSRITEIYSFDGPGVLPEVTETEEYRSVLPRVRSVIPEESVFGLLLDCGYDHQVVKSSAGGIWQHDTMTWQIMRNHFEKSAGLSDVSLVIGRALENWIRGMSLIERRETVDALFSIFENSGVENVSEITGDALRIVPELLRSYWDMDREDKQILRINIGKLLHSGANSIMEEISSKYWKKETQQ